MWAAQVEQDLAWARFLTGLHGSKARREVSDLVSGIVEYGAGLQLTEDKLPNIMEAAAACRGSQILAALGARMQQTTSDMCRVPR